MTIHIVTDSSARFVNPHFVQQNNITVVPNKIDIAGKLYREGIDLSPEEILKLIGTVTRPPKVISPTTADYVAAYTRLAHPGDTVISIHASRKLFDNWQNANEAARQLAGHSSIIPIDSQTLCAGIAMLVQLAVKLVRQNENEETIINKVRGAVERVYSVYYVESMDFLVQNKIMSPAHTILGGILGIKPFLTVEEGELIAIEKVRTRAQAVERLVEFLVEFTELEDAAIVQHRPHVGEPTRMLQDRLSVEFPGRHFPHTVYGATLASLIGVTGMGVVVLEEETDRYEDDFSED